MTRLSRLSKPRCAVAFVLLFLTPLVPHLLCSSLAAAEPVSPDLEVSVLKAGLAYLNAVRADPSAHAAPGTKLDKYSQYRTICVNLTGHAKQTVPLRWSDDLYRIAVEKANFLRKVSLAKGDLYMVHVPSAAELKGTGWESKAGWRIRGENIARSSANRNKIIHDQAGEMFIRGWINDRYELERNSPPGHRYSLLGGEPGEGQSAQREFGMAIVQFRIPNNPDRPHLYYIAVAIVR